MPSAEAILEGLATIANRWSQLAIGWHAAFGVLFLAFALGWRPSQRLLTLLLVIPLVSVSTLAWMVGNPFNGSMFAVLAGLLASLAARSSKQPIRLTGSWLSIAGVLLVLFGWIYPHFLNVDSWTTYAYAAPTGLIPCPTLSIVIGITLMSDLVQATTWSVVLAIAGALYGAIGVFMLGVEIDIALTAGALILALPVSGRGTFFQSVRSAAESLARH